MRISDYARIALRYDTSMSRAMLRACGIPVRPRPLPAGIIVSQETMREADPTYDGLADCMRQRVGTTAQLGA